MKRRAAALLGATLLAAPRASAAAEPWSAPIAQAPAASQPAPPPYGSASAATPGAPQAPNPYGSMQAGGLTPPPPLPPASPTTGPQATPYPGAPSTGAGPTEEQLDKAKTSDAGRRLEWAWLNVEGGFSHVGLRTMNPHDESLTAGFVDTTASSGQIGAGLGARLLFFTLGARGRIGFYSPYRIFSVGGEAGLHIPLGRLEPHVDLGGGFTTFARVHDARTHQEDSPLALHGFYLRACSGLDYYLLPILSIGLNVSFDLLGLTRPGLAEDDLKKLKESPDRSAEERAAADRLAVKDSSFGSSVAVTGMVGLHF